MNERQNNGNENPEEFGTGKHATLGGTRRTTGLHDLADSPRIRMERHRDYPHQLGRLHAGTVLEPRRRRRIQTTSYGPVNLERLEKISEGMQRGVAMLNMLESTKMDDLVEYVKSEGK